MIIVKDKIATIEKAQLASIKILDVINAETKALECEDDPAESIYFNMHIIASLFARMLIVMEAYGETYGIEKLDIKSVREIVDAIVDENIRINKRVSK